VVQWVAGRGSLITPVATPAANALDDSPDSKADANRTDSITRDDVDERAHDEAGLLTNELYTDRDNLPRIQLPQLNSPKSKETSQRLTVPANSTIVDGTADPFIANNEHLDKYLQEPVDEYVEQAGKDDQPYLSAPRAVSDHLEAGTLDLGKPTAEPPTLFLQR
jgi:hypothetical protein